MTSSIDTDFKPEFAGKNLSFSFGSSSEEMAGIRVTRAEFSRIMGCSKQAITEWVKSGRIVVGLDGRFDPRAAMASLVRTGDPARIRSMILAPLVRDIGKRDIEIKLLRTALAGAEEDADSLEGAVSEMNELLDGLIDRLVSEFPQLAELELASLINAIIRWVGHARQYTLDSAGYLLDHVDFDTNDSGTRAAEEGVEGAGTAGTAGTAPPGCVVDDCQMSRRYLFDDSGE